MGYNTVLVVLNDTVDYGAKDLEIGRRIHDAVRGWSVRDRDRMRTSITARPSSGGCVGASYGSVISQEHADWNQVVVVGGNTGWRIGTDDPVPADVLASVARALERHGYKVRKPSPAPTP